MNKEQLFLEIDEILSEWNGGDLNIGKEREELIKDKLEEAINYTHSCESDSELLKDKEAMTFYEYLLSKGYKMSNKHTWQIDNRDLSYDDIIKQRKEYEYSL